MSPVSNIGTATLCYLSKPYQKEYVKEKVNKNGLILFLR